MSKITSEEFSTSKKKDILKTNSSNFMIMIDSMIVKNGSEIERDNFKFYIRSILDEDSVINILKDVSEGLYKPKPVDPDLIKTLTVEYSFEIGPVMKHHHVHILLKIRHQTKLQVSEKYIRTTFQKIFNVKPFLSIK